MGKHGFLPALAVPAVVSALLGGVPAVAGAVTAKPAAGESVFGVLSPQLAARLSRGVDKPVIVVLKSQFGAVPAGASAARARSAEVSAAQVPLLRELSQVHARRVKRFALVNSVAATVSPLEERRLSASPAVAAVIPDATVTIPVAALTPGSAAATASAASVTSASAAASSVTSTSAAASSPPLHVVPGACAPKGKSDLVPEGLALTGTVSQSAGQPTARRLGATGAGVKVAYIADGVDPRNVNFITRSGKSVFVDRKDFTGDGLKAATSGGEAFLDANTIAGQGRHVYNVNGYTRQSYPHSCDVRIEGVAPSASLVGLDIFADGPKHDFFTTNSMIAQAINYAVTRDHVNVLNESFGYNPLPDTTQDVMKLFNDAAVKAGVVVSVASGDSGPASTIGSPATDPNVISVGATTQFQMYAQSNIGLARYFAPKGWVSDNISAFSSGGFTESGQTVNLVAPGDLSWASCDPNLRMYGDCSSLLYKPSAIEYAGGTSESAPFVSGAAALVIQAYRKKHHHRTPSPALVKQILLSTATDLGTPATEQGAGLLNSYKAVQLAESIGRGHKTGSTLFTTTGQLSVTGLPGSSHTARVKIFNTGAKTQKIRVRGRTFGADGNVRTSKLTLGGAKNKKLTGPDDSRENYKIFHFRVPAHQPRLAVSIAYRYKGSVAFGPQLTLVDPKGKLTASSQPYWPSGYDSVDVRSPRSGTWTAVVASPTAGQGGYTGTVRWRVATQRYASFGKVSPSSLSIAPGKSRTITFSVKAPSVPGDTAGAVVFSSNLGGRTSIPVTLRTQVDVAGGGAFSGVLTGGTGDGWNNFFSFTVPPGAPALTASFLLHNNNPGIGVQAAAFLVSPDGNITGYGQNSDFKQAMGNATNRTLTVSTLNPVAGAWTLIVSFAGPMPGTEAADPFHGHVRLTPAAKVSGALPDATTTTLTAGTTVTIPVTITNTSSAPLDYFADPRLATPVTMHLVPALGGSNKFKLPLAGASNWPVYFVPTHTTSIAVRQTSTVRAMVDLSPFIGDPAIASAAPGAGSLCKTAVSASYTAPGGTVTPGVWMTEPTECGPFASLAKKGSAIDHVTVQTLPFDPAVSTSTSDPMTAAKAPLTSVAPVEVKPGKSATIKVNITPPAGSTAGTVVTGTLYFDVAFGIMPIPPYVSLGISEVAALPYEYTVG